MLHSIQFSCFWSCKLWNKTQGQCLSFPILIVYNIRTVRKREKSEEFEAFRFMDSIYMYTHTHTYIHTHIYTHTHIHTYILVYIHPYIIWRYKLNRISLRSVSRSLWNLFPQILQVGFKMSIINLNPVAECSDNTFSYPCSRMKLLSFPSPSLWCANMVSLPNSWHWKRGGRGHTITCW